MIQKFENELITASQQALDKYFLSFQGLCDFLYENTKGQILENVVFCSCRYQDNSEIHVIASAINNTESIISLDFIKESKKYYLIENSKYNSYGTYYLIFCLTKEVDFSYDFHQIHGPLILTMLSSIIEKIFFKKMQSIRSLVISKSINSNDFRSFLHKISISVSSEILFCDELSIFLRAEHKHLISLGATNVKLNYPRNTFLYKISSTTNIANCYSNNNIILKYGKYSSELFDEAMQLLPVINRIWWPLNLDTKAEYVQGMPASQSIGVIRISNTKRRLQNGDLESIPFLSYHSFLLGFLSEVIYVLMQQYIQFMDQEKNYFRITHAIGSSIDTIYAYSGVVKNLLYKLPEISDEEDFTKLHDYAAKFRFNQAHDQISLYDHLLNTISDIESNASDLHAQFSQVQMENIELNKIDNFHRDVLIPSAKLGLKIRDAYGKRSVSFNSFKAADSLKLPSIMGNRDALISIFRNLIDNSVKYCKEDNVTISINFEVFKNAVVINYKDNSIGISMSELNDIFIEGFRGDAARRLNNKGFGSGLSRSKWVMGQMQGEIWAVYREEGGSHFKLSLART